MPVTAFSMKDFLETAPVEPAKVSTLSDVYAEAESQGAPSAICIRHMVQGAWWHAPVPERPSAWSHPWLGQQLQRTQADMSLTHLPQHAAPGGKGGGHRADLEDHAGRAVWEPRCAGRAAGVCGDRSTEGWRSRWGGGAATAGTAVALAAKNATVTGEAVAQSVLASMSVAADGAAVAAGRGVRGAGFHSGHN